jgi:gamma-glutamyltranspeptidase/glutathione hydrolase
MVDFQAYPFQSQRMPVMAVNGIVATSQPLAAQTGLQILREGGNAVDAAIATAVALTVLEPTSNGIGADAFALVWNGDRLVGLNGSGRAPASLEPDSIRARGYTQVPKNGWVPVTVPGAPAAWGKLHQEFARLPLEQLMAPAIAYAEHGFPVSPIVARAWQVEADRFLPLFDAATAHWGVTFAPGGRAPRAGELWANPDQARTLSILAQKGVQEFYEGEIAEKIVAFSEQTSGYLKFDDLAAHRSQWVTPINTNYRGYDIWEIPPNGQGLAALIALSILDGTDLPAQPHGSEAAVHLQLEAMKLAFADAARYIADPEHMAVTASSLLEPDYIAGRRALIGPRARLREAGNPPRGGTVYLAVADRDGMMVSFIQSAFNGFGSGVVVPETGIALHNRGACFTLESGHPNELAGKKRPYHTIIPAFLTRAGQAVGPFGVMGKYMQPQGHTQVVTGTIDYDLNPQAVLDAPRWQVTGGLNVEFELGTPEHVLQGLAARGHEIFVPPTRSRFGRGQIIWRLDEGVLVAGSDMRADGAAVGW